MHSHFKSNLGPGISSTRSVRNVSNCHNFPCHFILSSSPFVTKVQSKKSISTSHMLATHAQETCTRNSFQKLSPETCTKNLTQVHHSFLHRNNSPANHVARCSSHVLDSFCAEIELCSIACKKLVPEKTCTRLIDTRASFWYKTTYTSFWYMFLERMLPALVISVNR